MKKNSLVLIVVALVLVGLGWWFFSGREPSAPEKGGGLAIYNFDKEKCPGDDVPMTMNDVYMRGIIDMGKAYTAKINWYKCNPVQIGHNVLYRFSDQREPVVRRIVAIPGSKIEVDYSSGMKAWTIKVDGQTVQGESGPYFFGGEAPPPLANYAKANKEVVQDGDVVLLSSFPPGSDDSGTFGAISIGDVIARAVLSDEKIEAAPAAAEAPAENEAPVETEASTASGEETPQ